MVATQRERSDHELFSQLVRLCGRPVMERLFRINRTNEDIMHIADSVSRTLFNYCALQISEMLCHMLKLTRGVNGARSDDLKTMKSAVIDWITPEGGVVIPPLNRNVKTCRGFYHEVTGQYLCPTDYDWNDPVYVQFRP